MTALGPAGYHACPVCGQRATDWHHRLPRSRGGKRIEDDLNMVALCHEDHMEVHRRPTWAESVGLTVSGSINRDGLYVGHHPDFLARYGDGRTAA